MEGARQRDTHGPVDERERLLAERYGAPRGRPRPLVIAAVIAVAAVFSGWLVWTAWFHSTPDVSSELVGYDVVDVHTATGTVDVAIAEDVDASAVRCTLRAFAPDHAVVGELVFAPGGTGRQQLSVRTAREATSVELLGCTTADQRRPR
jgi:hypothetical protein